MSDSPPTDQSGQKTSGKDDYPIPAEAEIVFNAVSVRRVIDKQKKL